MGPNGCCCVGLRAPCRFGLLWLAGMRWERGGPGELEGLRVCGWVPTAVPSALLRRHHRPGVLVLEGGWAGRIWGLGLLQSHHFALDLKQPLLDFAEEVLDTGFCRRLDCVAAHAMLGISMYPRGTCGPGTAHRFWPAHCSPPPPVEILRAGPAFMARRAYELIVHLVGLR